MVRRHLRTFVQIKLTRTAIVGIFATLADLILLGLSVNRGWLTPLQANLPSLALGSLIQFLGNRYWVFKAKERPLGRQLSLFVIAEALAFALNGIGYDLLVRFTPVNYIVARPLSVTLIFFGFSYPLWHWIFHVPSPVVVAETPLDP